MKNTFCLFLILGLILATLITSNPITTFAQSISAPTVTTPSNSAILAKGDVQVSWEGVAGASFYQITLKDISTFKTVIDNQKVNGTSYTVGSSYLEENHTYKVSITAVASNDSDASTEVYFKIVKGTALASAKIIAPSNGAVLPTGDVKVQWDPVSGASSYIFYLTDVSTGAKVIEQPIASGTNYTIPSSSLIGVHKYKITIVAKASGSSDSYSESFFSMKKPTLSTPTPRATPVPSLSKTQILSPASNATLELANVMIQWSPVKNAEEYKIAVRDTTLDTLIVDGELTIQTKYILSSSKLQKGHQYKIAIAALAQGTQSWSVSYFSIKSNKLSNPEITNPSNNNNLEKKDFTVSWKPVPNAQKYKFAMRDLTTNQLIIDGKETTQTSYQVSKDLLAEGHKYRFAIGAFAEGYNANGSWSERYITIGLNAKRQQVLDRASSMCSLAWKPTKSLAGWKARYYFSPSDTYKGIAYSQTAYQKNHVGFKESLSYKGFYDYYTRFDIRMPKYGNDCSGFVSFAWNIERNTTYTFLAALKKGTRIGKVGSYNINNPSKSELLKAYEQLRPGDALCNNGHIMLFWKKQGGTMVFYEQTPSSSVDAEYSYPTCRIIKHTPDNLAKNKYLPIKLLSLD